MDASGRDIVGEVCEMIARDRALEIRIDESDGLLLVAGMRCP
jgi:hypothetical protein